MRDEGKARMEPALWSALIPPPSSLVLPIHRKLSAQPLHFAAHSRDYAFVAVRFEHVAHEVREKLGFELLHAASRHRGRTDADAARDERLLRVVRHRVLVDGDVRFAKRAFGLAPRQVLAAQVDEEEMAVGA